MPDNNKKLEKQPAGFWDWLIYGKGTKGEDWTPVDDVLKNEKLKEKIERVNKNFFKDQTETKNS